MSEVFFFEGLEGVFLRGGFLRGFFAGGFFFAGVNLDRDICFFVKETRLLLQIWNKLRGRVE